jgi:23S rRNA (cytidine1920-2'-O)/16S rRNA (cytidine1409-2'-O)-methyltransferase
VARVRLDTLLVERGLAASRERARALILAGQVRVGGTSVAKAGTLVPPDADLALLGPDHPYVGRGGLKLASALDAFGVKVDGREALDIGASTGGFTDVLLRRGATRVVALDVGHNQLDWRLRNDPRVVVIEGKNARLLAPSDVPGPVDIVTIDVSFISLRQILRPTVAAGRGRHRFVKPQFEPAGRSQEGRPGADPAVRRGAREVTASPPALAC